MKICLLMLGTVGLSAALSGCANAPGRPLPNDTPIVPNEISDFNVLYGENCAGCHGSNAKGTPLGSDLTGGQWLWSDGSLAAITHTIADGVTNPKNYTSPMPPMGGAQLSQHDLDAVAAYVWALGHQDSQK